MQPTTEAWRKLPGHAQYEVSDMGRVRKIGWRVLKNTLGVHGYEVVGLFCDGRRRQFRVHRLIAAAFIDNPKGKPQVNHKNGDKADNRASNLEWVTPSENSSHAFRVGLSKPRGARGELAGSAKLTQEDVRDIRASSKSRAQLAEQYGVTVQHIGRIIRREKWTHV